MTGSRWQSLADRVFPLVDQPLPVEERTDGDVYVVRVEIPGVDPARDLQVAVDTGVLYVRITRTAGRPDPIRSEFRYGEFVRSVALPVGAREDRARARYDRGVLEVRVPLRRGRVRDLRVSRAAKGPTTVLYRPSPLRRRSGRVQRGS